MPGQWLRQRAIPTIPHACGPPCFDAGDWLYPDGEVGDVWQCGCGRRWVIVAMNEAPWSEWKRRRLPWPVAQHMNEGET